MTTQVNYLITVIMALLLEQMKVTKCRKTLGDQMMTQFRKMTEFGRLLNQIELLCQQFHGVFVNGMTGVNCNGTPKLTLDLSEVSYTFGGAFTKWNRKSPTINKYLRAKNRAKELDVESSGMISYSLNLK